MKLKISLWSILYTLSIGLFIVESVIYYLWG
jgi:hypothetical protein